MNVTNQYLGLKKRDLQFLKRANKADPDALKLIAAAFEALKPPYKAGRLTNVQVSDLAELLNYFGAAIAGSELKPEDAARLAKMKSLLDAIAPFKVDYVAPRAAAPTVQVAA